MKIIKLQRKWHLPFAKMLLAGNSLVAAEVARKAKARSKSEVWGMLKSLKSLAPVSASYKNDTLSWLRLTPSIKSTITIKA